MSFSKSLGLVTTLLSLTACVAQTSPDVTVTQKSELPKTEAVSTAAAQNPVKSAVKTKTHKMEGTASYYGGFFHGRKTANGEIFNKHAYTAAHRTLPFGTYLLVTREKTGKQVIVRINDRGPYIDGRIIDLSQGSAKTLGMLHSGIAKVKLEKIQVDKKGYISGKNAAAIYKLAKQQKLPLKLKSAKPTKK